MLLQRAEVRFDKEPAFVCSDSSSYILGSFVILPNKVERDYDYDTKQAEQDEEEAKQWFEDTQEHYNVISAKWETDSVMTVTIDGTGVDVDDWRKAKSRYMIVKEHYLEVKDVNVALPNLNVSISIPKDQKRK